MQMGPPRAGPVNPQPATRNPQPATRNPQSAIRNPPPGLLATAEWNGIRSDGIGKDSTVADGMAEDHIRVKYDGIKLKAGRTGRLNRVENKPK